jgi:hypothetical protein
MSALAWLQPVQWKKEKQIPKATALPSNQWMLENYAPVPTLSDLVKKQVIFDKTKTAPVKKQPEKIEKKSDKAETILSYEEEVKAPKDNYRLPLNENLSFFFNAPPPPAEYQPLHNEINLNAFDLVKPELVQELTQMRKQAPVYLNQDPQVRFQDQAVELENQYRNYNYGIAFKNNLAKEFKVLAEMKDFEKSVEIVNKEKVRIRAIQKKASSNLILINGEPIESKVILDSEKNYTIRIETNDETIEINLGSDSLNQKVIKTPKVAVSARRSLNVGGPATIRSADTYPRNRY